MSQLETLPISLSGKDQSTTPYAINQQFQIGNSSWGLRILLVLIIEVKLLKGKFADPLILETQKKV